MRNLKKRFLTGWAAMLLFSPLLAEELAPPLPLSQRQAMSEPHLVINNRPLAKVNGRVISLYDVVKKMDLFLFDYYRDHQLSAPERYYFYMGRWQETLEEMVADELTLLDAAQREITIPDGEVREEMEKRFGPHTMTNLARVGLLYEEARTWVRNELIVSQMIGMRVHSKAFQHTTPQTIKEAYQAYATNNPPEDLWTYRVLSLRGNNEKQCAEVAKKAYELLHEKGKSLQEAAAEVEEEGVAIQLSDDYKGSTKTLSKEHFQALEKLETRSYSAPLQQTSRSDKSATIFRIFYVEEHDKRLPTPFEAMHDELKQQLLIKRVEQEKKEYINRLKKQFGYDKHPAIFPLSEDYRPFALFQ